MISIKRAVLEDAEVLFDTFQSWRQAPALEDLIARLKDDQQHFYVVLEGRETLGGLCFVLTGDRAKLNLLLPPDGDRLDETFLLVEARYPVLQTWTADPELSEKALRAIGFSKKAGTFVRPASAGKRVYPSPCRTVGALS